MPRVNSPKYGRNFRTRKLDMAKMPILEVPASGKYRVQTETPCPFIFNLTVSGLNKFKVWHSYSMHVDQ